MKTFKLSNYYYFLYVTKQDYDHAFNIAHLEVLKDLDLSPTLAARIYYVKEDYLWKLILRSRQKERNANSLYNTYNRNNKILNNI